MAPKKALKNLIEGGLRPATSGVLSDASENERGLKVLRELKMNDLRDADICKDVLICLALLLRHVVRVSDMGNVLDTLATTLG